MEQFTVRTKPPSADSNYGSDQASSTTQGLRRVCGVCPHTTAGLTINENADRMLPGTWSTSRRDWCRRTTRVQACGRKLCSPYSCVAYRISVHLLIERRVQLGTWQGIYLVEFDGPRKEKSGFRSLVPRLERWMPKMMWKEKYGIGGEAVDNQRKELFHRVSDFLRAVQRKGD